MRRLIILLGVWMAVSSAAGTAQAEDAVTLKDGTTVSGTVLRLERDTVLLQLDRSRVASINGEPVPESVGDGSTAPDFTAVDLKGATHRPSDPAAKVTVLKFWATWCPYCRADIATVTDLQQRYRDKGVRILAISVDQDPKKLADFVAKEHLPYPVIATAGQGLSSEQLTLAERYETQGIPAYFVIANGKIATTISGSLTAGKQDLEGPLKKLLGVAQ